MIGDIYEGGCADTGIWEISVSSADFYCKSQTALKNSLLNNNNWWDVASIILRGKFITIPSLSGKKFNSFITASTLRRQNNDELIPK
jgi:hypothetical protein